MMTRHLKNRLCGYCWQNASYKNLIKCKTRKHCRPLSSEWAAYLWKFKELIIRKASGKHRASMILKIFSEVDN